MAVITIAGIPTPLAVGMMTGALTSTPGLAAAIDATGDSMASIGYGIAYPFGVIGVVLFVQLVPKLLRIDVPGEVEKLNRAMAANVHQDTSGERHIQLDDFGFFPFMIATIAGMMIAKIVIPLPAGASFTLGTSGGPPSGRAGDGTFYAYWTGFHHGSQTNPGGVAGVWTGAFPHGSGHQRRKGVCGDSDAVRRSPVFPGSGYDAASHGDRLYPGYKAVLHGHFEFSWSHLRGA